METIESIVARGSKILRGDSVVRSGRTYLKETISRKDFLQGIHTRLNFDVQKVFELLAEAERNDPERPRSGFWAGIRLLMPVVETLAKLYYPEEKYPHKKFLKEHLDIPYPNLVWEMYRNSLTHGDMVHVVEYGGTKFNWGLSRGLEGHIFAYGESNPEKRGQINIDVEKLCQDLMNFIVTELRKAEDSLIEIEVGISNPPRHITSELDDIIASRRQREHGMNH